MNQLPTQIPGTTGIRESITTQSLAALFKVKESLANDELIALAVEEYNTAVYGMARAGVALLILKTRVPRGEFLDALQKAGISSQRGSEMMRVAERLSELPDEEARKIAAMRPTVVIALTRFTAEELSWACRSGHIQQLVQMRAPEISEWRRHRLLEHAGAVGPLPEVEDVRKKPRALEAATDELLGAVSRAWHEVDRAKRVVEQLLPPGTDEWQHARTELAHAAHMVIRGIADQTGALDDLLVKRFGVTVTRPREGEYHTLAPSLLVAINNATEAQADADTNARAKQRHARLKWRGAPPKTLDAVIANARNGDRE